MNHVQCIYNQQKCKREYNYIYSKKKFDLASLIYYNYKCQCVCENDPLNCSQDDINVLGEHGYKLTKQNYKTIQFYFIIILKM